MRVSVCLWTHKLKEELVGEIGTSENVREPFADGSGSSSKTNDPSWTPEASPFGTWRSL